MKKEFDKKASIILATQHFKVHLGLNRTAEDRYIDSIRTNHSFTWGRCLAYYMPNGDVTSSLAQANSLWKDRASLGIRHE